MVIGLEVVHMKVKVIFHLRLFFWSQEGFDRSGFGAIQISGRNDQRNSGVQVQRFGGR
jgi:hypothetical protein